MNIRLKVSLAFALVALFLFGALVSFTQAGDAERYFIKSDNGLLKALVGVHRSVDGGFTADLTDGQLKAIERLTARLGIGVEAVPKWHISAPPGACSPWPECKNGGGGDDGGGDGGDTSRIGTPSDQTPWGIELVYSDSAVVSTSGGSGVNVALLDTGTDVTHPDLARRIGDCKDFTKGRKIKNECEDTIGHGTHTAGTIAADNGGDGLGIWGVAPEASILAYKVCADNGCWTDDIAAAIDYAGSNGAHIVSMSIGGDTESSFVRDAIARNPHLLFVAAGGNDGPKIGTIDYPGANVNVMGVAAIDVTEATANFSSRGVNDGDYVIEDKEIEVGAPGVDVESTCAGGYDGASFDKDGTVNGYCIISGTSMATPHVSGLAAKLWQGTAAATRAHLDDLAKLHDLDAAGDDPATGFGLPQVQ